MHFEYCAINRELIANLHIRTNWRRWWCFCLLMAGSMTKVADSGGGWMTSIIEYQNNKINLPIIIMQ